MRIGDRVIYQGHNGTTHAATVEEVSGTGATGAKLLDLRVNDDVVVVGVPHEREGVEGLHRWRLPSKDEPLPDQRAELTGQPMALAEAEAEGELPNADRRTEPSGTPRRIRPSKRKT